MKTPFLSSFILLLCVHICCNLRAEEYYTLAVSQEPYAELSGDNVYTLSKPNAIDPFYLVYLTGFSFNAFGAALGFDSQSTAGQGALISSEGYIAANRLPGNDAVVCFHGYLCNFFSGRDATSSISAVSEGEPGKSILKVQWKNMGFANNPETDYTNFQIWLHEQDDAVSYHYGPNQVTSTASFYGLGGPAVGIGQGDWPNFSTMNMSPTLYLAGDAASPSVQHPSSLSIALGGVPAGGTVYTFRPAGSAVSVLEAPAEEGRCYPNPFGNSLTIVAQSDTDYRVALYDLAGREVASASGRGAVTIPRGDLAPGVYVYRVYNAETIRATGVVVAE